MPRGKLRQTTALFRNSVLLTSFLFHLMPCFYFFVTHPMEMLQKWILQHLHFFSTCCFFENDVLFLRKRRLIFQKTTSHFSKNNGSLFENDRSFLHNRRVVFMNTWGVEKSHKRKHKRIPRISFVKIPVITLPRARTYAHTTGVFAFLLSQVSRYFHNTLFFRTLECNPGIF